MSGLHVPQEPIEALAKKEPPPVNLSRDERDRIAHLALALSQECNRKAGEILPQVPYPERTAAQQAAARLTVVRVVQAMVLLGYLER